MMQSAYVKLLFVFFGLASRSLDTHIEGFLLNKVYGRSLSRIRFPSEKASEKVFVTSGTAASSLPCLKAGRERRWSRPRCSPDAQRSSFITRTDTGQRVRSLSSMLAQREGHSLRLNAQRKVDLYSFAFEKHGLTNRRDPFEHRSNPHPGRPLVCSLRS